MRIRSSVFVEHLCALCVVVYSCAQGTDMLLHQKYIAKLDENGGWFMNLNRSSLFSCVFSFCLLNQHFSRLHQHSDICHVQLRINYILCTALCV